MYLSKSLALLSWGLLAGCSNQASSPVVPDRWRDSAAFYRKLPEEEKIWDVVSKYRREMVQVTERPYRVLWEGRNLCARPNTFVHSPHGEHWIHVFITPGGKEVLLAGRGAFPEGTIILKQKFTDAAGTMSDFYTGMRKRERGYNSKAGDWEFFTLDSDAEFVTSRGRIESCIDCHSKYRDTDFVSRRYLLEPEDKSIW